MHQRLIVYKPLHSSLLIALVALMLILGACGSRDSTTGGQPGSTPPAQVQKCGSVETSANGLITNATQARQSENCFLQAYQQCHPATFNFTKHSLDSGAIHAFTIASNNGQCSISDAIQTYIAPHPPTSSKTYTCTGLTQQADGLHFASCGGLGDVVVPD